MSIGKHTITVLLNGSGAGSEQSEDARGEALPIVGVILAVHLDYDSTGSGTDVTLTSGTPSQALLSVANNNTDGWYYPRTPLHQASDGAVIAGAYAPVFVNDALTLTIAGGTAAGIVTATILVHVPE